MPDLARWQGLWEKEEGLRPENLMFCTSADNDGTFWHTKVPEGVVPLRTAADLIHMAAIRWLEDENLILLFAAFADADSRHLDDRLFAAVQKAMEGRDG